METSESGSSHTSGHSNQGASEKKIESDPRNNPENYVLKVFYYNPDDRALMVPMKWGSGVDFNYGRWAGKIFVLLILLGVVYVVVNAMF